MISGVHAVVFSQNVERSRAFFRDTLGLDAVDVGGGWLIFAVRPAELAVHPTEAVPHHELYLMCDDIDAAVAELRSKGIEVSDEIVDTRWGRTTTFRLPGAGQMAIYEPTHPRPRSPAS